MRLTVLGAALALIVVGCGGSPTTPEEGCRGHGGVQGVSHDATNSKVPFWCKDGTIGKVSL